MQNNIFTTVIIIYNGLMYNGQGSNFGENKEQNWRVRAEIRKLTDDHFSTKSRFGLLIQKIVKKSMNKINLTKQFYH